MVAHGFPACLIHKQIVIWFLMDFSNIDETREDNVKDSERMVFRYNREERISRAPEIVRDYYSGKFHPYKGGLLKSLVATKANRLMFVTIIFVFGVVLFMNYFGPQKQKGYVSGVEASLSSFSYGDTVYSSLKLSEAGKKIQAEFEKGCHVSVTFSAYDKDGSLLSEQTLSGNYDGKELYLRTTFTDYDIIKVCAVCSLRDSYATLESKIEKR